MKFEFLNDTGREVSIHPATEKYGVECDMTTIAQAEVRTFHLPEGTYPGMKLWDYGEERGLMILVTPEKYEE